MKVKLVNFYVKIISIIKTYSSQPAEQQYGGGHSVPQEVDDGTKSVEANDQTHDADNDRVNIHIIRWEYNSNPKYHNF